MPQFPSGHKCPNHPTVDMVILTTVKMSAHSNLNNAGYRVWVCPEEANVTYGGSDRFVTSNDRQEPRGY